MSTAIEMVALAADSPHLTLLARWMFEEWGHLNPGATLSSSVDKMRARCGEELVPSAYMARAGAVPAGTVSLIESDLPLRPDWSPWIASLYVDPAWRGRGVARAMLDHVERQAFGDGFERLHLFTDSACEEA